MLSADNWVVTPAFARKGEAPKEYRFGSSRPPDGWFKQVLEGTTYINDADDRDVDVLCVIDPAVNPPEEWVLGGSSSLGNNGWRSYIRDYAGMTVNLLCCDNRTYAAKWRRAAEVCRFLHLMHVPITAGVRHGIHEIIMDHSSAEGGSS